jgi:hypothetical protein
MIVNINPYDTGFEENSHVMKFSALAREVSTTVNNALVPRIQTNLNKRSTFNSALPRIVTRKVTISSVLPNKKVSEAHLEVLEGASLYHIVYHPSSIYSIQRMRKRRKMTRVRKMMMNPSIHWWMHCLMKSKTCVCGYDFTLDSHLACLTEYRLVTALRGRDALCNRRGRNSRRRYEGNGRENARN